MGATFLWGRGDADCSTLAPPVRDKAGAAAAVAPPAPPTPAAAPPAPLVPAPPAPPGCTAPCALSAPPRLPCAASRASAPAAAPRAPIVALRADTGPKQLLPNTPTVGSNPANGQAVGAANGCTGLPTAVPPIKGPRRVCSARSNAMTCGVRRGGAPFEAAEEDVVVKSPGRPGDVDGRAASVGTCDADAPAVDVYRALGGGGPVNGDGIPPAAVGTVVCPPPDPEAPDGGVGGMTGPYPDEWNQSIRPTKGGGPPGAPPVAMGAAPADAGAAAAAGPTGGVVGAAAAALCAAETATEAPCAAHVDVWSNAAVARSTSAATGPASPPNPAVETKPKIAASGSDADAAKGMACATAAKGATKGGKAAAEAASTAAREEAVSSNTATASSAEGPLP